MIGMEFICLCVFRKKRGHKPTGILVHAAKAIGFSSASEMIKVKGPENLGLDRSVKRTVVSPNKVCSVVQAFWNSILFLN